MFDKLFNALHLPVPKDIYSAFGIPQPEDFPYPTAICLGLLFFAIYSALMHVRWGMSFGSIALLWILIPLVTFAVFVIWAFWICGAWLTIIFFGILAYAWIFNTSGKHRK